MKKIKRKTLNIFDILFSIPCVCATTTFICVHPVWFFQRFLKGEVQIRIMEYVLHGPRAGYKATIILKVFGLIQFDSTITYFQIPSLKFAESCGILENSY